MIAKESLKYLGLFALLTGGLSFAFPLSTGAKSDLRFDETALPLFVGEWFGEPHDVPSMAVMGLPEDTPLSRRVYIGHSNEDFQFDATLVKSGKDINSSIHRPERCIVGQGWKMDESAVVEIPHKVKGYSGGEMRLIDATRVVEVDHPATGEALNVRQYAIMSYYFAGAGEVTVAHYWRNFADMWYRLRTGLNPQWHYVLVVTQYGSSLVPSDAGPGATMAFAENEELREARKRAWQRTVDFVSTLLPVMLEQEDEPR